MKVAHLFMVFGILLSSVTAVGAVSSCADSGDGGLYGTYLKQGDYEPRPYLTINRDGTLVSGTGQLRTSGHWQRQGNKLEVFSDQLWVAGSFIIEGNKLIQQPFGEVWIKK